MLLGFLYFVPGGDEIKLNFDGGGELIFNFFVSSHIFCFSGNQSGKEN